MLDFKKCFLILFLVFSFKEALAFELLISEIMYNPEGNDSDREWIEIVNTSNKIFKIFGGRRGWRINDGSNHLLEETEIILSPGEVLIITQNKNTFFNDYPSFRGKIISAPNMSLKNESGIIVLYDENKNLITQRNYTKDCGGYNNGRSLVFLNERCYESKNLKGNPGVFPDEALLESEEKNQNISFHNTNDKIQDNQVKEDNQIKEKEIAFNTSSLALSEASSSFSENSSLENEEDYSYLAINEFLPNPEGSDEGKEFIEIYNESEKKLKLDGLYLKIGRYKIKLSGEIEGKAYFLISNKERKFYLRNNGETIELRNKNEDLIHKISYSGKAPEGLSFSRVEEEWLWTYPTPGKENNKQSVSLSERESKIFENQNKQKEFQEINYEQLLAEAEKPLEKDLSPLFYILASLIFLFFLSLVLSNLLKL